MAEIYFAATGPIMWLKTFENELAAQRFNIKAYAPNGQEFNNEVNGMIEPIQIYRYVVSEPASQLAMRTLFRDKSHPRKLNLPLSGLRIALGLSPMPEDEAKNNWKDGPVMPVNTTHIQIVPIGYKRDNFGIIPTTGNFQEKI